MRNSDGARRRWAGAPVGRYPAKTSRAARPEPGLLLSNLRPLYLIAEEANVHWLALGEGSPGPAG